MRTASKTVSRPIPLGWRGALHTLPLVIALAAASALPAEAQRGRGQGQGQGGNQEQALGTPVPEPRPCPGIPDRTYVPGQPYPCAPPEWQPPAQLRPYAPAPLPDDRPRPVVDDYFRYVVTEPPPEIVARFNLDTTYYRKYADANGYPILASGNVQDAALLMARDMVNYMLASRPDIRDMMISRNARLGIMGETEYTMDIPEQRNWRVPSYTDGRLTPAERARYYTPGGLGSLSPEGYWNGRARGMGGGFTTCAEENLLGYYGTRYWGANICVHEFAHGIMGAGISRLDPEWSQGVRDAYTVAKQQCLRTAQGYAGNTSAEYWATGVEWYVGSGGRDRAALKLEDPTLYELIARLIPEDRTLPVRANVAARSRADLNSLVQEQNPEWWAREQVRVAEREAEREAARARAAGNAANAAVGIPSASSSGAGAAANSSPCW